MGDIFQEAGYTEKNKGNDLFIQNKKIKRCLHLLIGGH
jgi:hypothetical protein